MLCQGASYLAQPISTRHQCWHPLRPLCLKPEHPWHAKPMTYYYDCSKEWWVSGEEREKQPYLFWWYELMSMSDSVCKTQSLIDIFRIQQLNNTRLCTNMKHLFYDQINLSLPVQNAYECMTNRKIKPTNNGIAFFCYLTLCPIETHTQFYLHSYLNLCIYISPHRHWLIKQHIPMWGMAKQTQC